MQFSGREIDYISFYWTEQGPSPELVLSFHRIWATDFKNHKWLTYIWELDHSQCIFIWWFSCEFTNLTIVFTRLRIFCLVYIFSKVFLTICKKVDLIISHFNSSCSGISVKLPIFLRFILMNRKIIPLTSQN